MNDHKKSIDPEELEVFLDNFFIDQMAKLHIPGVVFVLVKDGKIVLAKGYGYSDIEIKKPILPDKTIFRMGSVSKLFTVTAILQLCERGLLNLEDEVDKYLKHFQLDKNYPEPIVISSLLAHTS